MTKSPAQIAEFCKQVVAILDRENYPRDIGCGHLGLSFGYAGLSIDFLARGKRLLITIYSYKWSPRIEKKCKSCGHVHVIRNSKEITAKRKIHLARAHKTAEALRSKVIEIWNGLDDSTGISFVVDRQTPNSLRLALDNGELKTGYCERFNEWLAPAHKLTERKK